MSQIETILWWCAMAVGLVGTAVLSGLETGIYRMSRVKLEVRAHSGPYQRAAKLLKRETAQPERLLAANLIANIFFGDLAATAASNLMSARGYSDITIILVNILIFTPIFFVFVESVPKELFRLEADSATYRLAPVLTAARVLLTYTGILPLVRLMTDAAARIIGGEGEAGLAQSGRERLATLLKDTAEGETGNATLSESQARLVDRAMEFGTTQVADEMQPWPRVRAVQASWSRASVNALLAREPHSYLPVVERDQAGRARVTGVMSAQDLYLHPDRPLARLVLEPARLPPRMSLREAVAVLRQAAAPVGIVEEGGRPVGLVTMSDLIEPLLRGDE